MSARTAGEVIERAIKEYDVPERFQREPARTFSWAALTSIHSTAASMPKA